MEGTMAEVRMFGGNFAPRSWGLCQGQLISINSNQALFSLLGTIYGGDGRTTFGLPDLRGRVPIGPGNGPGLSSYREGQKGGVENVILNHTEIPSHTHGSSHDLAATAKCNTGEGDSESPEGNLPATAEEGAPYSTGSADGDMDTGAISLTGSVTVLNTGGNLSHTNMQPWLALNYIVCMQGVFPSRS
jgi:microcystin-dependent protein